MSSDLSVKQSYWRSFYPCYCSQADKNNNWYNARDYCENCQYGGEFKCINTGSQVSLAKNLKKKKIRPSTINTANCRYDIVREIAATYGMKEVTEGWNIFWTDMSISYDRCKEMKRYQRINHFPGMLEICRKDLLTRNLNRMAKMYPKHYNFYPKTWCLSIEFSEVQEYCRQHRNKTLIVKPDIGCQGKGIFITKNLLELKELDKMICQVYIAKPFLIDGYKFDLRIYVLLTSCDPLRIYVYNEGLVRFATKRYKEPNNGNIGNMYMHLTNYSVNKHSRAYVDDAEGGSKRRISTINHWLLERYYNTEKMWKAVDDVIVKTIIVAQPVLKHAYQSCFPGHTTTLASFELLGFDFILDNKLKPYLLEVNHSPSFHTETDLDSDVKEALLHDTFELLNLSCNDKPKIMNEERKRVKDRLMGSDKKHLSDRSEEKIKLHEESMKNIFEWECSHLGNFRQAYPTENDYDYEAFMRSLNKNAGDIMLSRSRELSKLHSDTSSKSGFSTNVDFKSKCAPMRKETKINNTVKKTDQYQQLSNYDPGTIIEEDECKRKMELLKRESLLLNHGVLEKVYRGLKKAGRLQLEDEIKYGRNNNWDNRSVVQRNLLDSPAQGKSLSAKENLEHVFRLLAKRSFTSTNQEIPITDTLLTMTPNVQAEFNFNASVIRNTPALSPQEPSSRISFNNEIVEYNEPVHPNNEEQDLQENEGVINGLKISCENTIINEEPWILISSKAAQ